MPSDLRKPSEATPRRVAPLAKLPVFLDLHGKRAVVAGGGDAAAWKAELLAAAGAHVEVFAAEVSGVMSVLLTSGGFVHHARGWRTEDLNGAAVAIADANDDIEAKAFHGAALAAGVAVNVIDRPAFCSFQFGSIVNRSPVVVGISTDGAAPVLGQAIRRRIETLLPPALSGWATLAKSLRATLKARLPALAQRRAFWERFAERAFTSSPPDTAEGISVEAGPTAGHVTLVGAGPGDAELLTLKAVRALQAADVILFDDLVSDDVLDLARREAKRMLVGKRGGRASCRQDEINGLMVKLARQGKRVVRLKSGDPMIFGRAGEEISELRAAGISVEVVPGITAALAMASALGVSLTHRTYAQSLRLITGHGRNGDVPPGLDWRGLADPASTLVFYMAGRTAPEIVRRLIAQGLEAATPVVVVESLSRPEERRRAGRLDALPALCADGFEGPVLIGIGQVFAAPAVAVAAPPVPGKVLSAA